VETTAEQANASVPEKKEDASPLEAALIPSLASPVVIRGLAEILEQHGDWLDSHGETGIQADFSRENLEDADLIDARLPDALLNKTILKRADLMLADFRGASLLQANLKDANLLGTIFHQANLQAATLDGATGLLNRQLAGANLFGATLPADTSPSEGLKYVRQVASRAGWYLIAILLVNALAWLRIFTTRDPQLLRNAPAVPFFGLQADVPFVAFYLFGPVVILSLYVCFHLYLQRLWDGAAQLPAVFPDGRSLDTCLPWFARWSARMHSKWLKSTRSPLAFLEAGIAMLVLYWVAPATILLSGGDISRSKTCAERRLWYCSRLEPSLRLWAFQDGWESVRSRFAAAREHTNVLPLANFAASECRPDCSGPHSSPAFHWDHPGRSARLWPHVRIRKSGD